MRIKSDQQPRQLGSWALSQGPGVSDDQSSRAWGGGPGGEIASLRDGDELPRSALAGAMSLLEKSHRLQISVRTETSGLERSGLPFTPLLSLGN